MCVGEHTGAPDDPVRGTISRVRSRWTPEFAQSRQRPDEDVLKEEKPVVVSPPAEGASEGQYLFLAMRRAGMTMFHLQVSPWRKLLLSSCPLLSS